MQVVIHVYSEILAEHHPENNIQFFYIALYLK